MTAALQVLVFFATIVAALLAVLLAMAVYVMVSDWFDDRRKRGEILPGPGEALEHTSPAHFHNYAVGKLRGDG